jgi:hypothetical protein
VLLVTNYEGGSKKSLQVLLFETPNSFKRQRLLTYTELRLRVFENSGQRKIFGPKTDEIAELAEKTT